MEPLEFIAAAMGHKLVPTNAEPESWEMPKEIIEGYEAVATYLKAANDPNIHHINIFALRSLAGNNSTTFLRSPEKEIMRGNNNAYLR